MQSLGSEASQAFSAEKDIKEWANQTALNPGRVPPDRAGDPAVQAVVDRFKSTVAAGMERMTELAAMG